MGLVIFLVVLAIAAVVVRAVIKANQRKAQERREAELEPVRKLAFEDVTAFGEELQVLDVDMAGRALEPGEHADYQRALDSYESAKRAADKITEPEHVKGVTEIVEDGKYAMACVRARVDGLPLPTRRPPCFFDPRHGLSVEDVPYAPPGGCRARRTRLRPRRRAREGGRRARHPQGDGRRPPGAVLPGRPCLPAPTQRATSAASDRWT